MLVLVFYTRLHCWCSIEAMAGSSLQCCIDTVDQSVEELSWPARVGSFSFSLDWPWSACGLGSSLSPCPSLSLAPSLCCSITTYLSLSLPLLSPSAFMPDLLTYPLTISQEMDWGMGVEREILTQWEIADLRGRNWKLKKKQLQKRVAIVSIPMILILTYVCAHNMYGSKDNQNLNSAFKYIGCVQIKFGFQGGLHHLSFLFRCILNIEKLS